MATKDNYQILIEKLDRFIRKYYINQLIRGLLYSVGLILFLFLIAALLENYYYFNSSTRKVMFYSFLGLSGVALAFWVFTPLMHIFQLGTVISHEQAAQIIGTHFTDVKDKLLNILQLKKQAGQVDQVALINASINQKSESIKLVPFRKAIDLSKNRKYLRYALPPLLLLIIILFAAPSMIKDSTNRLINNDKEFEREAPFNFIVDADEMEVIQFDNYEFEVSIEGEELPNDVFVEIDNYEYRLSKEEANRFTYSFNNVQKDTDFRIYSRGSRGQLVEEDLKLNVLKKPNILGFDLKLDYPEYTGRKDESLSSIGDVVVPQGTNINWVFNAQNTDDIQLSFSSEGEEKPAERFDDELFSYKKRAMKDETYKLIVSNKALPRADSVAYSIAVVPDLHPTISVQKFEDSTDQKLLYFVGDASDDYGLRSLSFNYRVTKDNGSTLPLQSVPMDKPSGKQIQYDYAWDLETLELEPGDQLSYYFEVKDNDGINGSKSARTNVMLVELPTREELEEEAEKNDDQIKKDLEESLKKSKKIQEDMKKLREKLLQEKEMDWQTKKELEKLLERQKELEKQIEEAKKNFEENQKNQEEFSKPNEEILEKQEKLQKMFEEVMSDEMKELMEKIEELMQEMQKDEALDMMEQMQMNEEEMEMDLERLEELFKQLEMEQEINEQIEKLEELAKEQEELAEETENSEKSQEELEKKQEEINEKFEDIKKEQEELEEKNEELSKPKNMGEDTEEQMDDIQEDLNQSQEQLEQEQNKKASDSQKKAAQKMKQMASNMQQSMQGGEMEQMQEDMAALRQLLENLVTLSFDQEDLVDDVAKANTNTPHYVELVQHQYKLKDDFQLIEDSLQELSKRVFQIESFITEKVTEVKRNMKSGLEQLEERKKPKASEHQRRTMKNVNDLALMLNEVMEQMQQQMSSMMQGSQMCNKPGSSSGKKGSVPMDKITKGQGDLNKQMEEMKKQMEKKGGQKGMGSKEFAKMAAQQAALRKALREMKEKQQQEGKGENKQLQEVIDAMNKVETDLVNKRLNNEMLKRQQDILTRLLEAENAERQREKENKRKADTGEDKKREMPPSLVEYLKQREAEIDVYKPVSPSLKPYYKFLVEEYFKKLKD